MSSNVICSLAALADLEMMEGKTPSPELSQETSSALCLTAALTKYFHKMRNNGKVSDTTALCVTILVERPLILINTHNDNNTAHAGSHTMPRTQGHSGIDERVA